MFEYQKELNKKRNEFGKWLVFSILGIFLINIITKFIIEIGFNNYNIILSYKLLFSAFFGTSYVAYLISKAEYNFKSLYKIITFSMFVLVFYISLSVWYKSLYINLIYIPILLILLIIKGLTFTALSTVVIVFLCVFTPQIAILLGFNKPYPLPAINLDIIIALDLLMISFTAYISLLILYFHAEFIKIELKHSRCFVETTTTSNEKNPNNHSKVETKTFNNVKEAIEYQKFELLYSEIINCFEKDKPFKDADFNKKSLATLLQTNESYISKAIKNSENRNFNTLVNEYRITQIIEELNIKNHDKFTIEHIYTRAGFTQQSTFNRVFKECTGLTPSEYIENIENSEKLI